MPANLSSGSWKILSLLEGNPPTSINPTWFLHQSISINKPIQNWTIEVVDGEDVVKLKIEGYDYTGVYEGKVSATGYPQENKEWHVTHRTERNAYTIELAEDHSQVWEVSPEDSPNPEIAIEKYKPGFVRQLFRFEKVNK